MNKKSHEKEILDRCIAKGLKNRYLCKRLFNVIQGKEFERKDDERPDFVRVYYPPNKNEKPVLIGIEHFMVDHQAKPKGKSFQSPLMAVQSKTKEIYDEFGPRIQNDEDCWDEAVEAISEQIIRSANAMLDSSYEGFLNHFKYALSNHANRFNEYKSNLDKLAGDQYNTKLALLIEIQSNIRNYFVFDRKELRYSNSHIVPVYRDITDEIKSVCSKDIDYIYICFCYHGDKDRFEVAAARPKMIEDDLKKQGYCIYNYVNTGSDTQASLRLKGFTRDNDQFQIPVENDISIKSPEELLCNVFNDAFKVRELRKAGESYVTTEIVQFVVDEFEPYIDHWETNDSGKEVVHSPIFKPEFFRLVAKDFEEMSERFDKKWGIEMPNYPNFEYMEETK